LTLHVGARVGPYEVTGSLGAGGMGEVYRARDARLKRDVALKVLPSSVAGDAERLARFHSEAEVLASLNHDNVAALYGLEEVPSTEHGGAMTALIMELVEGPTLAERMAHGPMPTADVIPIARQIAQALEAAHERGIIHRLS
jgi:serine/threonine protein kinase